MVRRILCAMACAACATDPRPRPPEKVAIPREPSAVIAATELPAGLLESSAPAPAAGPMQGSSSPEPALEPPPPPAPHLPCPRLRDAGACDIPVHYAGDCRCIHPDGRDHWCADWCTKLPSGVTFVHLFCLDAGLVRDEVWP